MSMNSTSYGGFIVRGRASIDGWVVHYFEPTYGMREFIETTHEGLAKSKVWLNEGGYTYSVKMLTS
jgi:hypothetical protein